MEIVAGLIVIVAEESDGVCVVVLGDTQDTSDDWDVVSAGDDNTLPGTVPGTAADPLVANMEVAHDVRRRMVIIYVEGKINMLCIICNLYEWLGVLRWLPEQRYMRRERLPWIILAE